MANKIIPTRIVNKHDTEENWNLKSEFVPMQGEFIVYDRDENNNRERLKIGDGIHDVATLPFYSPPEIILKSYIPNSTKQFKLSVDDYGTICLADVSNILFVVQNGDIFTCGDGKHFTIETY